MKRCPDRLTLQDLDLESIRNTRAILGLCDAVYIQLAIGTSDFENLDYSQASEVETRLKIYSASLGFQYISLGELDFALGSKEGKCHLKRTGSYQKIISCAEKTPVVLYNHGEKRG